MPLPLNDIGNVEEHELPAVEAMLAGTLALMTGYSQALLAAQHPEKRLLMGAKIGHQLAALAAQPQLSPGFRRVLADLQQHWLLMTACTADSAPTRHWQDTAAAAAPRRAWH